MSTATNFGLHKVTFSILKTRLRTILDFKSTKSFTLKSHVVESLAKRDTLVNLGKNVAGIIGNDVWGIRFLL
jgi:hypothetical protein